MRSLDIDIRFAYRDFALEVDQSIPLEGITAIFGPSGSGKTTLLRVIAGLELGAKGTLVYAGTAWQNEGLLLEAHRRRVGFVFQDARLFAHLSVVGNLRFAARAGRSGSTIDTSDVIKAFDLAELAERRTQSLSGGERQRVAIARALVANPRLILMDEPLSSVDTQRKLDILPHIERLPTQFRIPVIYVSHDADEVARIADWLLVLENGKILDAGKVQDVFERLDLKSISGAPVASSILEVHVESSESGMSTIALGEQKLRVPGDTSSFGSHSRIRVHASDVVVATHDVAHSSIRNKLRCRLERISFVTPPYVDLTLNVDSQLLRARITQDACEELGLTEGMEIYALIKSAALDKS